METSVTDIENNIMLTYPDMSPPLLETIMRLTIEKVKIQRSPPPQSQSPRPGNDDQSQRPIPFTRSKSNSLLRTLLIIQIGRKTSRLLSLISQPEVCQRAEQTPSAPVQQPSPVQQEEQQQPKVGSKRRSCSDDEDNQSEEDSVSSSEENSIHPSIEKSLCLEAIGRVHSDQITSEESSSVSDMTQLSLQSPSSSSSNMSYNENPCPGCQCCSMWVQQRQESPNFQLCEPVRQC